MRVHIGILRTDAVLDQFQPCHGDYPDMFRRLLESVSDFAVEFTNYDVREAVPASIECDAYIITGSRHSVYEDLPWIPPLVEFVSAALASEAKIIAVCFGHQLMAHYFGGEVGPAAGGWAVGVHQSKTISQRQWMEGDPGDLALLSSHKDQVLKLPPQARLFASNDFCPLAGFTLPGVLTIQGHPEFNADYSQALMGLRRDLLGEETYQAGVLSLKTETDEARFARWMLEFVTTSSDNE